MSYEPEGRDEQHMAKESRLTATCRSSPEGICWLIPALPWNGSLMVVRSPAELVFQPVPTRSAN